MTGRPNRKEDTMDARTIEGTVALLSLKSLLETGKGAPAPNDIKLDSWE
jgi:hypothetical protein